MQPIAASGRRTTHERSKADEREGARRDRGDCFDGNFNGVSARRVRPRTGAARPERSGRRSQRFLPHHRRRAHHACGSGRPVPDSGRRVAPRPAAAHRGDRRRRRRTARRLDAAQGRRDAARFRRIPRGRRRYRRRPADAADQAGADAHPAVRRRGGGAGARRPRRPLAVPPHPRGVRRGRLDRGYRGGGGPHAGRLRPDLCRCRSRRRRAPDAVRCRDVTGRW